MNETLTLMINEAPLILDKLHFIRADWFYAFIPLILFLWLSFKTTSNDRNWHSVIDEQLMPFVLDKTNNKKRRYPLLLIFIAASLCITSLAGPVYKKLPQPVYREQSSLIVLFDLSQSMNAADIKPSRLSRAKLKLLDLLQARKTGQTALIVYAADAFVVTPLTDDNSTIANLVPSLATDMMPAQGSNLSVALAKTASLFNQAGIINGDILVITDDIRQGDEDAINKTSSQGYRLSIFGIGTVDGAPIPLDETLGGGFLQNSHGAIVIPKLQPGKLQRYALKGGGLYASLQADDSDVNKLSNLFQSSKIETESAHTNNQSNNQNNNQDLNADIWQEEGYWLLLPLLLLAALWARKGWIAALLPFTIFFLLPVAQPAYAAPFDINIDIDSKHLWSSPDQKAMREFNAGNNENAAKHFTNNDWKASALYRNGDYEAVVEILKDASSSDALYNKGNALAQLGKFKEAIKAYDEALEINESDEDTLFNHEQVSKALQQQEQDKDKSKDESDKGEAEQDSEEQDGDKQEQSEQKSEQQSDQDSEDSNPESEDKQQQDSKPTDSEQDKKDKEELKQRDAEAEAKQQEKDKQEYQDSLHDEQKDKEQQDKQNVENKEQDNSDSEDKPAEIEINPVEASITEQEKATEQWLKRIPDDPGGLLRRKFQYQYKQMPNQNDEKEPW